MKIGGVIFDRDGTIVHDVPYNGDPQAVKPGFGMREALQRLRDRGIRLAVVSNQSGVARGMITIEQVEAVNRRIDELLGPFDAWLYCPHSPDDNCECRKPKPQMILEAASRMSVPVSDCVVLGDKRSDTEAAQRAGAQSVFVRDPEETIRAIETLLSSTEDRPMPSPPPAQHRE